MVTKLKELYIRIKLSIAMWRYLRARQRLSRAVGNLALSLDELAAKAEETAIVIDFFGKATENTGTPEEDE